jgi:recombinational DNA repair ATPase RecF
MLRERWARDRSRKLERGLTLTGRHRDACRLAAPAAARSQLSRREDFPWDM